MISGRSHDLTTGSIPRHLMRLSVPMVWGILSIVSMQVADVYFVSRLGQMHLEAISFTFPVSMAVFNVVMGLSIATSSICARLIGARDTETFHHFVVHAVLIAVLAGIVVAGLGEIFMASIFAALKAGPDHMAHIMPFMRIQLWGYVFITVPLVLNASIRASGDTVTPSLIMISVAVINIPLSYLFVFGAFGGPELGMTGAAVANVAANLCAAILAVVVVFRRGIIDRSALTLVGARASAVKLLSIALPVGLVNLMQPLTAALLTAMLAANGAAAVAAYGVITRIEALAAVILMALSIGMSPLIGQNFGAGRYDRVRETLATAITFSVIWSVGTGGVLMVFGSLIAQEFTIEPMVIHMVATYFIIMGISRAVPNVVVGWGSLWYAMGRAKYGVINNIGLLLFGTILPAWIGNMVAGWMGVFTGMMVGGMVMGLALHFWSKRELDRVMATASRPV
jgi:putative MATE family efflux protein